MIYRAKIEKSIVYSTNQYKLRPGLKQSQGGRKKRRTLHHNSMCTLYELSHRPRPSSSGLQN